MRKRVLYPELRDARVVLRVPYRSDWCLGHTEEVREVEVPLDEFIGQLLANVEGDAFGQEDTVRLRPAFAVCWSFKDVLDPIEVEVAE